MQITASAISLNVDDVTASANFVKQHFGFIEEMAAEGFVSLSRADVSFNLIFLQTGLKSFKPIQMQGHRADGLLIVFVVDDIDREYARIQSEGVIITTAIETEPWGERFFQVTDPNGIVIQLVQWITEKISPSMSINLRPATAADLNLLRHWDEQPHIIASDPNDDWGWEVELNRTPEWREQLIAEIDSRPIGFIEIIDPLREDSHYWGDVPANLRAIDIWIGEETDLGKGYGTQMMQLALARCFADPLVTAVLVDPLASNTRVHRFYERLGFQFVEFRRFGEDDCFVYRLHRADWHHYKNPV